MVGGERGIRIRCKRNILITYHFPWLGFQGETLSETTSEILKDEEKPPLKMEKINLLFTFKESEILDILPALENQMCIT